jgi:hypothetical protein
MVEIWKVQHWDILQFHNIHTKFPKVLGGGGGWRNHKHIFLQYMLVLSYKTTKVKGKAIPLQSWSGPESSTNLRFPDFMTMAQNGGKVVSLTHRSPLPPGNTPDTHFC